MVQTPCSKSSDKETDREVLGKQVGGPGRVDPKPTRGSEVQVSGWDTQGTCHLWSCESVGTAVVLNTISFIFSLLHKGRRLKHVSSPRPSCGGNLCVRSKYEIMTSGYLDDSFKYISALTPLT